MLLVRIVTGNVLNIVNPENYNDFLLAVKKSYIIVNERNLIHYCQP